ncbi:FAD-dependent oxidoreductase [Alishewanella longhuensis]
MAKAEPLKAAVNTPEALAAKEKRARTEAELIIIGNGMACQRLLAELVQQPNRPARIVVFGAEAKPAYNRVLLSSLLSNELPDSAAELVSPDWYARHNIELICDDAVVLIERERKLVISQHGRYCRYQQLVLACGALPLTPTYATDSKGNLQPDICHFRNWQGFSHIAPGRPAATTCSSGRWWFSGAGSRRGPAKIGHAGKLAAARCLLTKPPA